MESKKLRKRACVICGSRKTIQGSDFLVCKKCGFLNINNKQLKEKIENEKEKILL